jgi:type I restriction enzyme S subunit
MYWVLSSNSFTAFCDLESFGSTINHLYQNVFERFVFPAPPELEQTRIAEFLDRETAKIDGLVAEQRRLMDLLKEKRQAVISHAVTRGLNPEAPLKPSGIEWLGDVPAHWEVRRIGSISTKITNGFVGPTRDIFVDQGIRYLQSMHIKENEIRYDESNAPYFVSEDWSNEHAKSILETGDVLIVQTGEIGQVAVVPPPFAGCNCHALIIVAPHRPIVSGDWLAWVLNSDYGYHTLLSIQTGALHPHLNCGDVKDISIPLPHPAEQKEIVAYIGSKLREFDPLTAEAQRAIELLQERRTALISAAVTGQIDVR